MTAALPSANPDGTRQSFSFFLKFFAERRPGWHSAKFFIFIFFKFFAERRPGWHLAKFFIFIFIKILCQAPPGMALGKVVFNFFAERRTGGSR